MRKIKRSIVVLALLVFPPLTLGKTFDVDQYLREVDLTKLIYQNNVLNLSAQMKEPTHFTTNINEMSDFIALGVKDNQTIVTEFDSQTIILNQKLIDLPWIGVKNFYQTQIPNTTLQQGLKFVQTCMAKQHYPLSGEIHRVTLYKVQQTNHMIYDYVFKNAALPDTRCEEILYSPVTDECQRGMVVKCHHNINNMLVK